MAPSIGKAAEPKPKSDKAAVPTAKREEPQEDWMDSYYKNPQPDRLVAEVRKMSKAGQLSDESSTPAIVAMLGRVMAQNPDKISAWMTDLAELPENDKVAIYRAIWLSRTDAGNAYLKRQGLTKYVEKPATDILKMEIESPSIISMIWGCFLATGDEAAVRRIVSAFNYSKYQGALEKYRNSKRAEEDSRDACYEAVFQGAVSSLGGMCQQHPRVREICNSLLQGKDLNETERKYLAVVLDSGKSHDNEAANATPDQSQPEKADETWMKSSRGFSAMLMLSDDPEQFLKDWNRPTAKVALKTSEAATRGKPFAAFIIFMGCDNDAKGHADVVADLTLVGPDGKVLAEQKNVQIWQNSPAPPPREMQLGTLKAVPIQPDDPAGEYEMRAKVQDRVKGATVELSRKFTVPK
jgi:hypothetical protein